PRKETAASFASPVWRRDAGDALRRLVRHVEESEFADRVVGYHVTAAHTEEWFYLGTQEGYLFDYSAPAARAFREYLRKVHRDESRLRRAWNDRSVTFDTAAVPSAAERLGEGRRLIHDPARSRAVLDYHLFLSDLAADTVLHFARIVKEASGGRALFG